MNKEKTNQSVQTRLIASLPAAQEPYTAPDIEVTDIEIENCFAASPTAPDFTPGPDWN